MTERVYQAEYRWVRHTEHSSWAPGLKYGEGRFHIIGVQLAIEPFEVGSKMVLPPETVIPDPSGGNHD